MGSAGDELTVNASNNFTLTTGAAIPTAKINNTGSAAITVTKTGTASTTDKLALSGNDIVIKDTTATAIATAGVEVTSSATKSTIELSATTIGAIAAGGLNKAQVSEVLISGDGTLGITVNENTKLVLAKDQASAVAANIDNAKGDMGTKTGTLLLDVNASQTTSVATGANVDTVLLTAGKLADKDGKAQTVTIKDFITHTETDTIVVNGANDLVITKLSSGDADTVVATAHTGKLTISDFTKNTKVFSGSNDDTFKVTTATAVLEITSGAGNDTVDLSLSTVANTINLGEGDDTVITGSGGDKITLGAGKDTVIIDSTKAAGSPAGAIIADAVIGEDKIILTGTANNGAALNVAALGTINAGFYDVFGTAHEFTLTGSTASDLSGLVQFGKQAVAATATTATVAAVEYIADDYDFTAGSADDQITTGNAKVNAGAGNDVITTGGAGSTITGGAGSDTFKIGHNATIADLGATDILQVTADVKVSVDVVESFTAAATTTNASSDITLNLKDGVNVDMTLATLGSGSNGYTITTDAAVTKGATIVGSRGEDTITGSKFDDIITGGEGEDTITGGAGADTIILTESVSVEDTVVLGTVSAAGIDTIVGFNATDDQIKFSTVTAVNDATNTDLSSAKTLTEALVLLTATDYSSDATIFKYDSKTYLLINDSTQGYDATADAVVEISGYVGTLDTTDFIA